jgi:hypothetical protein
MLSIPVISAISAISGMRGNLSICLLHAVQAPGYAEVPKNMASMIESDQQTLHPGMYCTELWGKDKYILIFAKKKDDAY